MRMILRRITAADAREAATFLDSRTLVLRWLVAFFQHFRELPEEEEPYWSLWRGDAPGAPGMQLVAAHFFQNGTTYVCADAEADLSTIEGLLDEELLPEKVVGDSRLLRTWQGSFPGFAQRVDEWRGIRVLKSDGGASGELEPEGFRLATGGDLPVLEEYGHLLEVEMGEDFARDFESLVEHGLVFVVEGEGRLKGYVRSNVSDGRFVHAGGLYVHPLYRGKGVGRALARGLAVRTRQTSSAAVILDVYDQNTAALRAYEGAGYEPVGEGMEARFEDGAWSGGD